MDLQLHTFASEAYKSVVRRAVRFFATTPIVRLPPPEPFAGCGVYALYYSGDFAPYAHLSRANRRTAAVPIYVGKAVPPGTRKARRGPEDSSDLYGRLAEHSRSIEQATNLHPEDFVCRFMILTGEATDLVVPAETELIRRHQPLWNCVVDGFGNHDPGAGRYNQAPSEWDVLHPGRYWVSRLTGVPPPVDRIVARIRRPGRS
jgi:hypothetical protein